MSTFFDPLRDLRTWAYDHWAQALAMIVAGVVVVVTGTCLILGCHMHIHYHAAPGEQAVIDIAEPQPELIVEVEP